MDGWYERPEDVGLSHDGNIVGVERLRLDVMLCTMAVDDLTFDEYFDEHDLGWKI